MPLLLVTCILVPLYRSGNTYPRHCLVVYETAGFTNGHRVARESQLAVPAALSASRTMFASVTGGIKLHLSELSLFNSERVGVEADPPIGLRAKKYCKETWRRAPLRTGTCPHIQKIRSLSHACVVFLACLTSCRAHRFRLAALARSPRPATGLLRRSAVQVAPILLSKCCHRHISPGCYRSPSSPSDLCSARFEGYPTFPTTSFRLCRGNLTPHEQATASETSVVPSGSGTI